ncbi:MAG: Peptidase M16 inactive domain protein [Bacteroidetes bacterium ADurb.Bin174]|nr:MAG: Peptidase M16 inactive domain protein [Bacteroidetes bacterium ADurb.Bin174]
MKSIKLFIAFLFLSFGLFAQQMPDVPIDPKVRYGKLDNGLTYYIRHNEKPKERAEFYIAQNVGAILENDDQNGLAHFLEHMAFNGTKNFPDKLIIEYFETVGVKFGANINAYTSLDETVYNLSNVPTIREGIVDSALLVLHDWSGFISLLGEEIDAERGVIREEWRTGAGPERRMWKAANYLKYPDSQYAKRDVIGDTAVINNFDHEALRAFYRKWYRPDLQAIAVVGDIDVDRIEEKIKIMFADIPAKENAGERPIYPIHDNVEPIISIVKDKEARVTRIELEYKHDVMPDKMKKSIAGYMFDIMSNIISTVMSYRFDEITQQADASFVDGGAFYGNLVKSKDAFNLIAIPKEGQEAEGLKALLLEAEKIRRFGLTNSEIERAKIDLLTSLENAYNDRDNQSNRNLVREYVRHFLDGEVIPGIEWEFENSKTLMPFLTAETVNAVLTNFITDENLIISFMAPDKPTVLIPSEEEILQILAEAKVTELTAKEEEDLNKPLIEKAPKAGKIKKASYDEVLETTQWKLSNGVKVIFKKTDFKNDEILMNAFSEGGLSKVKNMDDLVSGNLAASVVANNGLGEFSTVELNKVLTGKIASASPNIGNYYEGFSGRSSVTDFETMLQLVYLYYTAPRKDDNAYGALINMYKAALANKENDPRQAFSDSISLMIDNHHPRSIVFNLQTLEQLDQDKALAIFKDRFALPADFTFIFTGNIDVENETVKQAVLTYLGGLKSKKKKENFVDNNIRTPQGVANNYFTRSMEINKASNFIVYSGTMPFNMQNNVTMTAIGSILNIRYLESIREKEGGSYGVGVRGSLGNTPIEEAILMMQFDTDPEKQAHLMGIIHKEVNEIVADGPRQDDLQKVKENMLKKYKEDLRENQWWSSALTGYYRDDLNYITDYTDAVNNLTEDLIQLRLKELVDQGNVMEVVMMPKE